MKPVIQTFQYGKPKVIKITGTPDDTTTPLQPAAGYLYIIASAWCYHDDSSSRSLWWSITDGTTTIGGEGSGSIALNTQQNIYAMQETSHSGGMMFPIPIIASNTTYPIANVNALTAGKLVIIEAFVYELAEAGG